MSHWVSAGQRGCEAVGTGEAEGVACEGRQPPWGVAGRPADLWVSESAGCAAPGRRVLGTRWVFAETR